MPRDPNVYLEDILSAIEFIESFIQGFSKNNLEDDPKTLHAVIRDLEVIGEAVKHLPDETKNLSHQIEWKKIAGLRDILIHEYFGIDIEIIWDVITHKIPDLKNAVKALIDLAKKEESS